MERTDDDIRHIAKTMQDFAFVENITMLNSGGHTWGGSRTLAIVRDPRHSQHPGAVAVMGPYEVSPLSSMMGRAFNVIVFGNAKGYGVKREIFDDWFNNSVRTRLEPGGIVVEAP